MWSAIRRRLTAAATALAAKRRPLNRRLVAALACYAALGLVAGFALDGYLRLAVLGLFVWLALKTWVHSGDEPVE